MTPGLPPGPIPPTLAESVVSPLHVCLVTPFDVDAVAEIARRSDVEIDPEAELERRWARVWVARFDTAAAASGFLLAWHVADELHVMNVATHPDCRRRGVANALVHTAVTYAQRERVRLVLLEVRKSNRAAIQLYRSHGFSAMGIRRGYYARPGSPPNRPRPAGETEPEDAVEMILALDPETGHIQPGRDEVRLAES